MSKFDFFDESDPNRDTPLVFLGGSSFVGLHVAQTLFYFYDIYCSYNKSQAPVFYPEFLWKKLDFINQKLLRRELKRLLTKSKAKFVVNFVGDTVPNYTMNNSKSAFQLNVGANKTIIEVCNELEIFPILISSDKVFSGDDGPYSEDSHPNPKESTLGEYKYLAEQLYNQEAEDYAILRLSSILGISLHFQPLSIYPKIMFAIKNKKQIQASTNHFFSPSHVFNVAFFLHKLVDKVSQEPLDDHIFHIPGKFMSEFELMVEVSKSHGLLDTEINEIIIPYKSENNSRFGLTSSKTKEVVDARYLTFQEGLKVLYNEFSSNS